MARSVPIALLGLALVVAAALFDAEPLYVPGVAVAVLAGVTTAWVHLGARGVTVDAGGRRAPGDGGRAGARAPEGPVRAARAAGRRPGRPAAADAVAAARRAPDRERADQRALRAARAQRLAGTRVVVRDPLGLAERVVAGPPDDEVLVLPRVDAGAFARGRRRRRLARGAARPAVVAAEVDLDGVRPHRPGTPASRIFWPALARGAELMERRLRADTDTRPLIVLDPRAPASADDLDAAVRATASLCVHLARRGGCAVLLPGRPAAREPRARRWRAGRTCTPGWRSSRPG